MTENIEITRRKVLASVGAVGAAGASAGLGTSALFSDEESFESNTLAAGELDLKVDWQQRYFGPQDDDFPAYGKAGYPWVNAHPDEGSAADPDDPNGIQSLDSDEYDSVPDDGYVTYADQDANIQEYLTCETLDHDYAFGPNQDRLIELEDVKPGDSGEITFSFHLCDNPGYVWLQGGNLETSENGITEPEAQSDAEEETSPRDPSGDSDDDVVELADLIEVRAWYDLNCNNEFDTDEELVDPVFEWGTLREVIGNLSDGSAMLNPVQYASTTESMSVSGESGCLPLGKIEGWQSDQNEDAVSASDIVVSTATRTAIGTDTEYSTGGERVAILEPGESGNVSDTLELVFRLENTDTGNQTFVRIFNIQDEAGNIATQADPLNIGEVIEFDFETLQGYNGDSSDNRGICQVDLKAGTETKTYDLRDSEGCSVSGENLDTEDSDGDPTKGLSNVFFYYCPGTSDGGNGTPDRCFPGGETFCVGFEWRLPERVGNEVQSDSVSFDLGFYTEQCRNNDGSGQSGGGDDTPSVTLPADKNYIGYEDRTGGDFDYNDFGMDADITETYSDGALDSVEMEFTSLEHTANDSLEIHLERTFDSSVDWELTVGRDHTADGTEKAPGTYNGSGTLDVVLFDTDFFEDRGGNSTVTLYVNISSGSVSAPTSSPRPDVAANNPLFEVYDPYMLNRTTDKRIDLGTIQDNRNEFATESDVPNVIVVPDPDFDPPGAQETIDVPYPEFDEYYGNEDDDGDLDVNPTYDDWYK